MTKTLRVVFVTLISVAWPAIVWAQLPMTFKEFIPSHIDTASGSAASNDDIGEVIASTLKTDYPTTFRSDRDRVYVLVHILRWSDPVVPVKQNATDADPAPQQQVQRSNWYVYSNDGQWTADDFERNKRLFGVSKLWLLAVHLNLYVKDDEDKQSRLRTYTANYVVTAVAKKSTPLAHFGQLAALFPGLSSVAGAGGAAVATTKGKRLSLWSAKQFSVPNPSDIAVAPKLTEDDAGVKDVPLGDETKFDNEGRHSVDVAIGVPIRAATDLQADTVGGTAVPKVISKTSAFATLDVFFKPVDVKDAGLRRIPHGVVGVAITRNPKDAFFVGLGWGPAIANFFGAVQWTKLDAPDAAGRKYDRRLIIGVELPIGQALIKQLSK